ncbi:MAG: lipid A-modifier LpxR family protein, partial [Gemmatimonadaceae bacterium]
ASLGTLLTELRGGIGASVGFRRHFRLVGDATARGVARSEVLSGTFFRPSERVPLRPLVTEVQFGARGTWRRLSLAWIAHRTSAEYTGRARGHSWSTLQAEWRR